MKSKMSEIETVDVKIKVPKPIIDFLKDARAFTDKDFQSYLEWLIIVGFEGDLDSMDGPIFDKDVVHYNYGLNKVFQDYDKKLDRIHAKALGK